MPDTTSPTVSFEKENADKDFFIRLCEVFARNGMEALLTKKREEQLLLLARRLVSENKKYNLTAITDQNAIILRHIADSLTVSSFIPTGARVLDVGTGAGFPSLPLAICRPDVTVTALDATAKKIRYVTETATLLSLDNYEGIAGRAEELCRPPYRGSFDVVLARAVSELSILSELCLPFCRTGGAFLAMKGTSANEEAAKAAGAIDKLGGGTPTVYQTPVTDGEEELLHAVVVTKKEKASPTLYPRVYAKILKEPLS